MVNPNKNYDYEYNDNRPVGVKGAWVKYSGTLKEAIAYSKTHDNGPFKSVSGPKGYGSDFYKGAGETDDSISLEDWDLYWGRESGGVHLRMNTGWYAQVRIGTSNSDFFEDNVSNATNTIEEDDGFEASDLYDEAWPSMWVNDAEYVSASYVEFILGPDDYISFDIDSEYGNIAQARIKMNGENFLQNTEIDDEVWIEFHWLAEWDANYPARGTQGEDEGAAEPEDEDLDDLTTDDDELDDDDSGGGGSKDDDDDTDDDTDYGDYSLLLVFGGIALILYAAFWVARPSGSSDE